MSTGQRKFFIIFCLIAIGSIPAALLNIFYFKNKAGSSETMLSGATKSKVQAPYQKSVEQKEHEINWASKIDLKTGRPIRDVKKYDNNELTEEQKNDSIKNQLKSFRSRYQFPENISYKRSSPINFLLEIEGPGSAKNGLLDSNGLVSEQQVQVSSFVLAKLSGPPDSVKITLRGGEKAERQYAGLKNVVWTWDVEGLRVGQVDLQLQLLAELTIQGKSEPVQIETFKKTVRVDISRFESFKEFIYSIKDLWPLIAGISTTVGAAILYLKSGADSKKKEKMRDIINSS